MTDISRRCSTSMLMDCALCLFQVKKDYRTGLPRGYGFIKMKTIEDQQKVLKEGEFYIDGRMAQVSTIL